MLAKCYRVFIRNPLDTLCRHAGRASGLIDRRILARFAAAPGPKQLHIGCGANRLPGWLNSDYRPHHPEVLRLDASKRFPFADGAFDLVYSEHMIEHIGHLQGAGMVRECFRILKPGGRIRIATPDLAFLLDLCRPDKTPQQDAYIAWFIENRMEGVPFADAAFVINHFVRAWGHTFIHSEATLRAVMDGAGFSRITRCGLNESECPELRGLENETRMPPGFLRLETLVLEGVKS